jgi:hypothetical protein
LALELLGLFPGICYRKLLREVLLDMAEHCLPFCVLLGTATLEYGVVLIQESG